jgi:hypothetical protein
MATLLGTIPEDFPITGVYTAPSIATLPALVYGQRPTFSELIWDADSGFTDNWRDRSSLEGNDTDGYVFRLSRRAFSAAGMVLFWATAAGGGGGSGDATSIQGIPIVGTASDDQVLVYDAGTNEIHWEDESGGGGSGDVVGPASAVDGRIALFDGTTGKLIKQSTETVASVEAAAVATAEAYTDAAIAALPGAGSPHIIQSGIQKNSGTISSALVVGVWQNYSSFTLGGGTGWVDKISGAGITRATGTSTFTVSRTGYYHIDADVLMQGADFMFAQRVLVAGVHQLSSAMGYGGSSPAREARSPIAGVVFATAGDTIEVQWTTYNATTGWSFDSGVPGFESTAWYASIGIHEIR